MNNLATYLQRLKSSETIWIVLVLFVAALLRFWAYGSFSYSNDELSAIARAQFPGFHELVNKGFYVDGHPGGIQVLLWLWMKVFGTSEWSVRLPFVIMGIAAVFATYKTASFMFGRVAGLFSAAAISFLQFPLLYSQIARPYGPGMLFSLVLMYFWLQVFFNPEQKLKAGKPSIKHLAGFAISAALCMYTHYFSFLFALIVGFSGFFVCRKNQFIPYVISALFAAFLFVPHIYITLNHLTYKGLSSWLGVQGPSWVFEHLYYIFDFSVFTIVVIALALLGLFVLSKPPFGNNKYRVLLLFWFLLPIAIGYFYSINVSPVLQHPVLIFSFPAFLILLFSFADAVFNTSKKILLLLFLIAGTLGTIFVNGYFEKQHFGEFKNIAKLSAEWNQKYAPNDITKAISINNPYYVDFYFDKLGQSIRFDQYDINTTDDLQKLSQLVSQSSANYFLLAITKPSPTEAEDIIRSRFPYLVEYKDYRGMSSVALYSRVKGKTFAENYNFELVSAFTIIPSDQLAEKVGDFRPEFAYKLDSVQEYSLGLDTVLPHLRQISAIQAEVELFSAEVASSSVLVISVETSDGKSLLWQGAEAQKYEQLGRWSKTICTSYPAIEIPEGSKLKVYCWNKLKRTFYLSKINVNLYSNKNEKNK